MRSRPPSPALAHVLRSVGAITSARSSWADTFLRRVELLVHVLVARAPCASLSLSLPRPAPPPFGHSALRVVPATAVRDGTVPPFDACRRLDCRSAHPGSIAPESPSPHLDARGSPHFPSPLSLLPPALSLTLTCDGLHPTRVDTCTSLVDRVHTSRSEPELRRPLCPLNHGGDLRLARPEWSSNAQLSNQSHRGYRAKGELHPPSQLRRVTAAAGVEERSRRHGRPCHSCSR